MKRIGLGIVLVALAVLTLSASAHSAKPFRPLYDLISISDATPGGNGDVVQQINAPQGDHVIGFLKFSLPTVWDIAEVQSGIDEPIVGSGQLQIDVDCNTSVETYSLTIFDEGRFGGDPPGTVTNWLVQGYPFEQFSFTVDDGGGSLTIEGLIFSLSTPLVCTPMILDLTFQGISSDNPETTGTDESLRTVLTNPGDGVYTWSLEFTSKPFSDPPEHLTTRCDQVGIGSGVVTDTDVDGIPDACDNCPSTANADQRDFDLDGIGDVCDGDQDNDGVLNASDLCPDTGPPGNPDPVDADGCTADQLDPDNDGICSTATTSPSCTGVDNCPGIFNPGQENDVHPGTTKGDHCEDPDFDFRPDAFDNCPDVFNFDQKDGDTDEVGNVCDNCPSTANGPAEAGIRLVGNQLDTDGDGLGDACDPDIDDDGVLNASDNCPSIANGLAEAGTPGVGNQLDTDSDGLGDACDPCPLLLDCDGDGWTDWSEVTFIGTDPDDDCADNALDDALPVDFNNDTFITSADLGTVAGVIGQGVPPAPARFDIDPDPPNQVITVGDLSRVAARIGQGCTP